MLFDVVCHVLIWDHLSDVMRTKSEDNCLRDRLPRLPVLIEINYKVEVRVSRDRSRIGKKLSAEMGSISDMSMAINDQL